MEKTGSLKALLEDGKTIIKNEKLNTFYRAKELYETLHDCHISYLEFDLKNGKTLIELDLE